MGIIIILGIIPFYLSCLSTRKNGSHNLTAMDALQFVVPKVRTELGKKAYRFSAPNTWNKLHPKLKL